MPRWLVVLFLTTVVESAWLSAGPGASAVASSAAQYYSWCMDACMGGASSGSLMATVMTAGMAAPAAAGGLCYGAAACATACASITGGTAVAVGVAAGAATGGACFADGSLILARLPSGEYMETPVEKLLPGDVVKTLSDTGDIKWTTVMENKQVSGPVALTPITARSKDEDLRLMVTAKHLAIIVVGNKTQLVNADALQPGMFVPLHGAVGSVVNVESLSLDRRNILVTREGTVVANGMLVSTTCEDIPENLAKDGRAALAVWRERHEAMWEA